MQLPWVWGVSLTFRPCPQMHRRESRGSCVHSQDGVLQRRVAAARRHRPGRTPAPRLLVDLSLTVAISFYVRWRVFFLSWAGRWTSSSLTLLTWSLLQRRWAELSLRCRQLTFKGEWLLIFCFIFLLPGGQQRYRSRLGGWRAWQRGDGSIPAPGGGTFVLKGRVLPHHHRWERSRLVLGQNPRSGRVRVTNVPFVSLQRRSSGCWGRPACRGSPACLREPQTSGWQFSASGGNPGREGGGSQELRLLLREQDLLSILRGWDRGRSGAETEQNMQTFCHLLH